MYKVISIQEYTMTRDVLLRNKETNHTDLCFDDSDMVSTENFDFLELGKEYECKIRLVGEVQNQQSNEGVLCMITNSDTVIGTTRMVEVRTEEGRYYIDREELMPVLHEQSFYYDYFRKDLVQVHNTIHGDFIK